MSVAALCAGLVHENVESQAYITIFGQFGELHYIIHFMLNTVAYPEICLLSLNHFSHEDWGHYFGITPNHLWLFKMNSTNQQQIRSCSVASGCSSDSHSNINLYIYIIVNYTLCYILQHNVAWDNHLQFWNLIHYYYLQGCCTLSWFSLPEIKMQFKKCNHVNNSL